MYDILNLGRERRTTTGKLNKGILNDDLMNYTHGMVLLGTPLRHYFQFL